MNMKSSKANLACSLLLFLIASFLSFLSGREFLSMHKKEAVFPGKGLTSTKMLSSYFPGLKNTQGDTDVYLFEGEEKGGNLLILGGTHPNEPAGFLTAVLLIENIRVSRGKVIIVPRANNSGFTHSEPQEGNPQKYYLETPSGRRWFRYGSRLTNPVHQWPDPSIYLNPAGQKLSGTESRNLNRCYPGRKEGRLTEKVAWGIMELIRKEKVDLALDLHEAAPEYPVINALVFHENSAELAALSLLALQLEGFEFRLEASPKNLRGLSHREWGDQAQVMAILLETANASQGRFKGKSSPSLITEGKDKNYVRAAKLGRLFIPYEEEGIPLSQRIARHLAALKAILSSLRELDPEKKVEIEGMPSPVEVREKGAGRFLNPPH
jgi:predicted deacylase